MATMNNEVHVTRTETCAIPTNRLIVGYARSRTESSIARQHQNLNNFCEQVYGRPLDEFYQDISGARSKERDGMSALMKAANEGDIGVLLVEDIDRIARKLGVVRGFEFYCERMDIKIHTLAAGHAPVQPLPEVDMASVRAAMMRERRRLGLARAKAARAARG